MRKTVTVMALTLGFLMLLDLAVAVALAWAERTGRLGSLVQYFEYGRSVPGKLDRWTADPKFPGNLFDVGWRSDIVARSAEDFAAAPADSGPVIRSYGMSFVVNIRRQALELRPDLTWEAHAGPAAPPNFTYALFQDDRANRRAGDIVVLGVLSTGIPAMAALSNRTWLFEQPAPLTYPVYQPEEDGALRRVEPEITSAAEQRALAENPEAAARWEAQLAREDGFYSPITFGLTWADASPFLRLVRRSLAKSHVDTRKAEILAGADYPYATALRRMIRDFAATAREDGQIPVVLLVQLGKPGNANLLEIAKPALAEFDVPYFATAEHFDPANRTGYAEDGHFAPEIDRLFAARLIEMLGL